MSHKRRIQVCGYFLSILCSLNTCVNCTLMLFLFQNNNRSKCGDPEDQSAVWEIVTKKVKKTLKDDQEKLQQHNKDTETTSPPLTVEQTVIEKTVQKLINLSGLARESAFKEITRRVKVTIVGKEYDMKQLILNSITVKPAPIIHAVIADEVIQHNVERKEYVKVVVPLFTVQQDTRHYRLDGPSWCCVFAEMDRDENISAQGDG